MSDDDTSDITSAELIRARINTETARIRWHELQRYFAGGYTLFIDQQLDLIEVACEMHDDNAERIEGWMNSGQIRQVSNEQARQWYNDDAEMWACVVKPWVLIQPLDEPA
jgi:hypothetical protein